jgi:hypothetical protein
MANGTVAEHHWFPRNVPQTLQIAVVLLYWNSALGLLIGLLSRGLGAHLTLLIVVGEFAGAYGIANERRWGYVLALCVAVPALFLTLLGGFLGGGLLDLVFQLALVGLLLHPHSRSYFKTFFR